MTASTILTSPVALIDADAFYCSCERIFNPKLHRRPVVVLSNNDGCVIARTSEAKSLGIKMGTPAFQIEHVIKAHDVQVFSSNYALYGDLSRRLMDSLATFSPDLEIYSIDEAFLGLSGFQKDLTEYATLIKRTVYQWTGLPVTIGIGETKTLAKVATHIAKTSPKTKGVLDLTGSPYQEVALERTPVEEVWGIGPAYTKKLHAAGIYTALDLRNADDRWIRRNLTVVGLRTVHELRGIPCLPIELAPPKRKCITYSRSFGKTVDTLSELKEAVATFVTRAAEKLRRHKLATGVMTIFASTNRFDHTAPQYSGGVTVELANATDSTPELMERALAGVERIYKEGYAFKKAGIILNELAPAEQLSLRLFENDEWLRSRDLMRALDQINGRHGRETIRYGSLGSGGKREQQRWPTKFEKLSPRYTTSWKELPLVKA